MNDLILAKHIEKMRNSIERDNASEGMLKRFFKILLPTVMEISNAEEAGILVVDNELKQLRIEEWKGLGVDVKSRIINLEPSEKSVCAWVVAHKEIALVEDVLNNKEEKRFLGQSTSQIRSELAVPVISRNQVIGVVNLESTKVGDFTLQDAKFIQTLCDAISHDWELASLLDWKTRIVEQHEELSKINDAIINGSDATLDAIYESLLKLIQPNIADILLLDDKGENLISYKTENLQADERKPIPRDAGIVGRCMREGRVQLVGDVKAQGESDYLAITQQPMRSMLAAPLIRNGVAVGVISVESERINQFSLEDAQLMKLLAEQAVVAVTSADLIAKLEATKSLASLGNMTGNLAHRMNNIVGGIRISAGFLASDLERQSPELGGNARQIESAAKDALDVVGQYETMFQVSEETFDLAQLILRVSKEAAHSDKIKIIVNVPTSPVWMPASQQQMKELVSELIRNAIKHMDGSGKIEIGLEETDYAIIFNISDTGRGISAKKLEHIFELGSSDTGSLGFGLWWAKNFVKSLGGNISVNSNGGGAVFEVVFEKNYLFGKRSEGGSRGTPNSNSDK